MSAGCFWRHVALGSLAISGCTTGSGLPEPGTLPQTIRHIGVLGYDAVAGDLDGDGSDEVVYRYTPTQMMPARFTALMIVKASGEVIDQLNYSGFVRKPLLKDVDDDGRLEVLAPVVRGDSLFLSVANANGRKLYSFFMTTGESRKEPEGPLLWDPNLVDAHLLDVDGDRTKELVVVISTGYARAPRGIFVYTLPDGRLLQKLLLGVPLRMAILADVDRDGQPDILATSVATNNGASAGGFDDSKAYLFQFHVAPVLQVERFRELPGAWTWGHIDLRDATGDDLPELLVIGSAFSAQGRETRIEVLDPRTWSTVRERVIREPLASPAIVNLDRDPAAEIVAIRSPNEVWAFDGSLEVVRRRRIPSIARQIAAVPDLDGDGIGEIVVHHSDWKTILLDSDFSIRAVDTGGVVTGIVRRGLGQSPLLLVERSDRLFATAELRNNDLYLLRRYGTPAAQALAVVILLAGLVSLLWFRRSDRLHRAILAGSGSTGLPALLVTAGGRVRWIDKKLEQSLGSRPGGRSPPHDLDGLAAHLPGVVKAVRRYLDTGGQAGDGEAEDPSAPQVMITRTVAGIRGDPHYLIFVSDPNSGSAGKPPRAWELMAHRLAHGIKNPLSSMWLTLQRLQMEYREQAPAVANRFDRYVSRVEGQIQELRRVTSGFLKFVDLERPHLVETDLNVLVTEFGGALQPRLPPDIRLELRQCQHLPSVRVDGDQIRAVLDNLVANAVNAMPNGGLITIVTDLAHGVQWSVGETPHDFVQLEVLDTGTGIEAEARAHLLEPGFSGREGGSGLGLAIVAKIVSDHGGCLTFETEVGAGSAFTVHLPAAEPVVPDPLDLQPDRATA